MYPILRRFINQFVFEPVIIVLVYYVRNVHVNKPITI